MLGLVACGLIVRPVVASLVGDVTEVVVGVFMLAVTLVGHICDDLVGTAEAPAVDPMGRIPASLPGDLCDALRLVWRGWSIEDGGPPSLWIVPWVGLAGVSLSWLLDDGDRRNVKRGIAFLATLVVLAAGNGFTAAALVFRSTDGLGLRGPATPEAAVAAFTANTCLFTHDWYLRGGKPVAADCPDWSGQPGEDLSRYLANDRPRQALERWYRHHQAFEALPRMRYDPPTVQNIGGKVVARLEVELPIAAEGQDLNALTPEERWCCLTGARRPG